MLYFHFKAIVFVHSSWIFLFMFDNYGAAGQILTLLLNCLPVCYHDAWPIGPCVRLDAQPIKYNHIIVRSFFFTLEVERLFLHLQISLQSCNVPLMWHQYFDLCKNNKSYTLNLFFIVIHYDKYILSVHKSLLYWDTMA